MNPQELATRIEELVEQIESAHSESYENLLVDDLATFVLENWPDIVDNLRKI